MCCSEVGSMPDPRSCFDSGIRDGAIHNAYSLLFILPPFVKQFLDMATLYSGSDHPNICAPMGVYLLDGIPAIVTEFYSNGNIMNLIDNNPTVDKLPLVSWCHILTSCHIINVLSRFEESHGACTICIAIIYPTGIFRP
jgi:hypothetical protein